MNTISAQYGLLPNTRDWRFCLGWEETWSSRAPHEDVVQWILSAWAVSHRSYLR
jgi:hypothetical protein